MQIIIHCLKIPNSRKCPALCSGAKSLHDTPHGQTGCFCASQLSSFRSLAGAAPWCSSQQNVCTGQRSCQTRGSGEENLVCNNLRSHSSLLINQKFDQWRRFEQWRKDPLVGGPEGGKILSFI